MSQLRDYVSEHQKNGKRDLLALTYLYSVQVEQYMQMSALRLTLMRAPPGPVRGVLERTSLGAGDDMGQRCTRIWNL